MVPVKIYPCGTYYKQKTGRVMKNILRFCMLIFCGAAWGAPANYSFGGLFGDAKYLDDVANAWLGNSGYISPSSDVASYVHGTRTTDVAEFSDAISTLGFNSTSVALFEINNHLDQSFSVIGMPLLARRDECVAGHISCDDTRRLVLDGHVFGSFATYDAGMNSAFKTRNTGVTINAKMFVTDGLLFGASYTRTMTDTHDTRVYSDAVGNSLTLFGEYLGQNGLFINFGLNAGHTSWAIEKIISLVNDNGTYDTNFFAGQFNTGIRLARNNISIVPQIGIRYSRIMTDAYTDSVLQSFDKWWYNMLTAGAGIDIGYDFIGSDFVIRPAIHIGGGYDVISNGTPGVHVNLNGGNSYTIPIDAPHRTMLDGAVGVTFFSPYFNAGINYRIDARSEYMAHTVSILLKIGF